MNTEKEDLQWFRFIRNFFDRCVMKIRHEVLLLEVKYSKISALETFNGKDRQQIVVSLTSFPARFHDMDLCLKSLFRQSVKPDHIVLWLGKDSIKSSYRTVFEKYIDLGLEIFIDEKNDYKSHKKYFYAFEKYPSALVITVDDDLVYPRDMIESLVKGHNVYPHAVIARRVHKITWDDQERIMPYLLWEGECQRIMTPSHLLVATTGAGTLFPPGSLYEDYNNIELIQSLAPTADDIWLKFMLLLQGTKVVWAENSMKMPASLKSAHIDELAVGNCDNGENDIFVRRLVSYYKVTKKDFED